MQKRAFEQQKQFDIRYEQVNDDRTRLLFCDPAAGRLPMREKISFLHYHDFYEVGICTEGEGLFYADGKFWTVRTGDTIFVPPGQSHYSRSLSRSKPCRCRFLYLRAEGLSRVMGEGEMTMGEYHVPTVIRPAEHPRAAEQLAEICRFCFEDAEERERLVAHQLAIFLLDSARRFAGTRLLRTNQDSTEQSVAERLKRHLSIHYRKSESAGELAAIFHMSESQLRRRFVAAYGIPPIAYRNRLRCEIACELLQSTALGIAEIAEQVGFDDPTDFYRRFRAEVGQSPSDFRKKSKQG